METNQQTKQIWWITGSQHLYGDAVLKQVAGHSQKLVQALQGCLREGVELVWKPVVTDADAIQQLILEANSEPSCMGIVAWMHTFSPAKMWIGGLNCLQKPLCHFHTQWERDIPWKTIDMDYMNLHQSAHGDREFAHILSRMRIRRFTLTGHWADPNVQQEFSTWVTALRGWNEFRQLKVVRFGDNMRQVAVTEGDKVEAQRQFGLSVNTHGVGDLVESISEISDAEIEEVFNEYHDRYEIAETGKSDAGKRSLKEAARIELGLRNFLKAGGYGAFTTTFEDLHGLCQLPGIAVQRLMAEGYGFGAEGDWKHAALVRVLKAMDDFSGQTSFMEDYTYHFDPEMPVCLGSHMLEICPSIADGKASCEIHPLGIGGKEDPVRLVFNGALGSAINVSWIDLGNRFRWIVNEVESIEIPQKLPKLPVARVLWKPKPSLNEAATYWMMSGGAHHTAFSLSVKSQQIELLSEIFGIECIIIDNETKRRDLLRQIQSGEVYFGHKTIM